MAHLSRQLAAKLMDYEQAVSIIELRDRTIEDLIRDGTDLNQRLQQEIAARADLTARLGTAEQSLRESRTLLLEHDDVIAKKMRSLCRRKLKSKPDRGARRFAVRLGSA